MNLAPSRNQLFSSLPPRLITADNGEIICADACKDAVYVLANNHGIKSPEAFGILVCNHFLSLYAHITNVCLTIEDYSWNRLSYDAEALDNGGAKLHNHAFIHRPDCVRTCSVTMNRKGSKRSRLLRGNFQFVARFKKVFPFIRHGTERQKRIEGPESGENVPSHICRLPSRCIPNTAGHP
jgi:urate oxidase